LAKIIINEATGENYVQPDQQSPDQVIMSTYVDNVNTGNTGSGDLKEIKTNMKYNYNIGKQLLEASGEQLAPEKCNYYITKWAIQKCGIPKMEI
jgi:hypothetical protein